MIFGTKCLRLFNIAQGTYHNLRKYGYKYFEETKPEIPIARMSMNIVWIDLELTGLDMNKDGIMEVACLITDANLQTISTPFHTIVHQPDELLNTMDEWCTKTHGKSGLTEAVKNSKVTTAEAEEQLLKFIKTYVVYDKMCPMAGNSIYMDRLFIKKLMPKVDDYLHYRIIDVTSLKELAKRWYPDLAKQAPRKRFSHRTLDDIEDSIEELKFFRRNLFKE